MCLQRRRRHLKHRGCGSVRSGQGGRTTQGEVTDEYGAMVGWRLAGENRRNSAKALLQCHFVHHEYHMESHKMEL
jgi:hypothetical protein